MNVSYNASREAPIVTRDSFRVPRFILLPLGLLLWAIGVSETNTTNIGLYGLLPKLPLIFYIGIMVLIVSAGLEFAQSKPSGLRLGLHATSLVVILYGTAPLVYSQARYAWFYKTVGVVQYVGAHGSLDRSIDIYQNWPGFFAAASWFGNVAGAGSPLDYGKWAQLVFELAAIPLLYAIYESLSLPVWHRWLAIMLYMGSNWIGADYFSPQGLSTLFSLGIMAIVARWMLVVDLTGPRKSGARALPFIAVLLFLFFVLTASHELSPYILAIQLAALAVTGIIRPRWVALAAAAIAIAYLVPNFSYVNNHYGLLSSLGKFMSNVQAPTPGSGTTVIEPRATKIIADSTDLLSVGIWLLALVGAWLRRKERRIVLGLLLLTCTPILVLVGGAYGNEGVLRVYLFSLPWAAALAVCALAPLRPGTDNGRGALRAIVPLALAIALFFPSFFGSDSSDAMTQGEVETAAEFLQTAAPGPILGPNSNAPLSDTARYNEFPVGAIFGSGGAWGTNPVTPDIAAFLARTMVHDFGGQPAYIVVTPSNRTYIEAYGLIPIDSISDLLASLSKSPYWKLLVNSNGTTIYKLSAAVNKIPTGTFAQNLVMGVP